MPKKKKSIELQVVLIGGKGVGKYSLREQFIKGWIAPKDFEAPPGSSSKKLVIDKKTLEVTVAILGELKSDDENLKKSHGIVLLYNISDKTSMEYIHNEVVPFLREFSSSTTSEPSPGESAPLCDRPVILLGNKADEAKLSRAVNEEDGTKLSEELKCGGFFETSATCNENVKKSFECLATSILEKMARDNPPQENKKRSKCNIL